MKMSSFFHTPWNTEKNRDLKATVERVRNGLDSFGRKGEVLKYILEHEDRFKYLLDRDGEDAGLMESWCRSAGCKIVACSRSAGSRHLGVRGCEKPSHTPPSSSTPPW